MSSVIDAMRTTSLKTITDDYRRLAKRWYKMESGICRDKLAHSMADGRMWHRFRADEDGEGWKEYGFATEEIAADYGTDSCDGLTDSEIEAWFEECMRIEIYSAYDCTGRKFTRWIDWHRNPNGGISYIHAVGIDC